MFLILNNSQISIANIEKHLWILTTLVSYLDKEVCLSGFSFTHIKLLEINSTVGKYRHHD